MGSLKAAAQERMTGATDPVRRVQHPDLIPGRSLTLDPERLALEWVGRQDDTAPAVVGVECRPIWIVATRIQAAETVQNH